VRYYLKQCKCGAWMKVDVKEKENEDDEVVDATYLEELPEHLKETETVYKNENAKKLNGCPYCK
jgi:hypothetical protein